MFYWFAFIASLFAAAPAAAPAQVQGGRAEAVFAGGCFWCTESDFDKIPGVLSTTSGYIGGKVLNPTYEQVSAGGFRGAPLRCIGDEDGRAILIAAVAKLPARVERIDRPEETLRQRAVADLAGIVDDLHRLDMPGPARRHLLVGRLVQLAPDVAGSGRQDAGDLVEIGFGAPEAAAGEDRLRAPPLSICRGGRC